jgi:rubrerythrin
MDLSSYNLEDVILTALKSEIEARKFYLKIAEDIKNAILKDRLKFIAEEELRHREFFEEMYQKNFPDKSIELPKKTKVPLPELDITGESMSLVEIFEGVMAAEKAAFEFYNSFADQFEKDTEVGKTLKYFANMEMGHYRLFELEKENMEKYEDFDSDWPMMHVGP